MADKRKLDSMPWISKKLLMSIIPKNSGWTGDDIDITYNMAIDEFGFDKSMVNRGNVVKMVMNEWKDAGFPITLKDTPQEFLDIGELAGSMYYDKSDSLSKGKLLDYVKKYDKEYDIYSDKGFSIIEELINRDMLNLQNIRNLYFDKYEDKYNISDRVQEDR